MSRDQMQDVFPIVFNFVKGEQPTAEKLTGLVRHVDGGFSRITQGIGDPWDYASHTDGSGTRLPLSLNNLGQSSLARIIGASDWLSPMGGCWNEPTTASHGFTLRKDRNAWTLGFPLVKTSTDATGSSLNSVVTPLTWGGTEVGITAATDVDGVFASRKTTAEEVVAHGDFYVDFYKGTIISYSIPSADVTGYFYEGNMFGVGVPWGTHNVIPHWNQTLLCTCAHVSSTATTSTYTITFPQVDSSSRLTTSSLSNFGKKSLSISSTADVTWDTINSGDSSLYRVPAALTTSGISIGDEIPEGYFLLWEGGQDGRVIPQTTFYYNTANILTVVTPLNWLSVGDNYRVITSGTSTADALSYVMATMRNNEHVGIADSPTLSYTMPLSHSNLEDRFTDNLLSTLTDITRWKFRESSYGTNQHPQYLHRGGYMEDDEDGNSANAMRGDLVMAGDIETGFELGQGSTPQDIYKTAAISFGGGNTSSRSSLSNSFIRLEGVDNASSHDAWTSGLAKRIPFGLEDTGTCLYSTWGDTENMGALSLYPWKTTPLYLRGGYTSETSDDLDNGAILGFDLGQRNEVNYVKLMKSIRASNKSPVNLPADTGQTGSTLGITADLSSRICSDQIREFRFRGVPYVSGATNTDDSVGGVNTRGTGNGIEEFEHHFTSPAIVGADFFNVYSNAIFFSDTGDGSRTSFTTNGSSWLDSNSSTLIPSGLYYTPKGPLNEPYLSLYCYDHSTSASTQPFSVGDRHGMWYGSDQGYAMLQLGSTVAGRGAAALLRVAANDVMVFDTYGANQGIALGTIGANSSIKMIAGQSDIEITSGATLSLEADEEVQITTDGTSITGTRTSANNVFIDAGSSSLVYGKDALNSFDSNVFITANASMNLGLASATRTFENNIFLVAGTDIFTYATGIDNTIYLQASANIKLEAAYGIFLELSSLPTSSSGLVQGRLWRDGDTIKIAL